jgi:hypothetical protein
MFARYAGPGLEVVLTEVELEPAPFLPPSQLPDGELHSFGAEMRGMVSVNGSPAQPFAGLGGVESVAYGRCFSCCTGTWQSEILILSIGVNSSFGQMMIRQSLTLPSLGVISISDIGLPGPPYHIDSFFDVYRAFDRRRRDMDAKLGS